MAQGKSPIPEKQLLKLIRRPNKGQGMGRGKKHKFFSIFSPAVIKGRLSFFRENVHLGSALRLSTFDLKKSNQLLQIIIVLLLIYFAATLVQSTMNTTRIPDFSVDSSRGTTPFLDQTTELKSPPYYLEKARSRDLFKFARDAERAAKEEPEVERPVEEEPEEKPTDYLTLVGIGLSEDPDVMIKDTKNQDVHFLKRGEWLNDEIKVQAIFQDRVILLYKGEEIELR